MKKTMTTTTTKKKNEATSIDNNNSQNVTVGMLADAQKPVILLKSEKGNGADDDGISGCAAQKDRYIYCNFAQIEEEEHDVDYEIDQEGLRQALDESTTMAAAQTMQYYQSILYLQHHVQLPPVFRASESVRSQRFPTKLYALLSQPQLDTIITWMPHGRSWKVLKPRVFQTSVLPVFFESDDYHSFNRVINAWSFRRKSTGPDRGSYFHELFLRGKPHLQKHMHRLPRTHKKLAMAKTEEPDFFELEKTSASGPLPTLEQARRKLESRRRKFLRPRREQQQHFENKETTTAVVQQQGGIIMPDNNNNNNNNRSLQLHHNAALSAHNNLFAHKQQHVQNFQGKQRRQGLNKHVEAWLHEDQSSNLSSSSPPLVAALQSRQQQQQSTKDNISHQKALEVMCSGVDQYNALGIHYRTTTAAATQKECLKAPDNSLFRLQQQQDEIKDKLDLQQSRSRVSAGHSRIGQSQQQQHQVHAGVRQQQVQVQAEAAMMRQQEQQRRLIAMQRHHRAQMMQQQQIMEQQEQHSYLRAQGVRQAELQQQQQQDQRMNLLRQMDFLQQQQQQRNGF